MTCEELEDKRRKLDRELLYLLNKLRSHLPPKPKQKTPGNTTNGTTRSTAEGGNGGSEPAGAGSSDTGTGTEPPVSEPGSEDKAGNRDKGSEQEPDQPGL